MGRRNNDESRRFHKFIFFIDETTFRTNRQVTSQNSRHSGFEKPYYELKGRS